MRYRGREVGAGMGPKFLTGAIGLSPTKNLSIEAPKVYPFVLAAPMCFLLLCCAFWLCLLLIFCHSSILISHSIFNISVGYISHVPGSCSDYSFSDSAFPSPMFRRKNPVINTPNDHQTIRSSPPSIYSLTFASPDIIPRTFY